MFGLGVTVDPLESIVTLIDDRSTAISAHMPACLQLTSPQGWRALHAHGYMSVTSSYGDWCPEDPFLKA